MKKIFLVLLIFLFSFSNYFPEKAHANALVKIATGSTAEKVMIGIAEKAGVKFATKEARKKALQRWNYDWKNLDKEIDQEIIDRYNAYKSTLDNVKPEPLPNNPGWSKVIINSAMFLTGADLIYEGYQAFKNAYDTTQFANTLAEDVEKGKFYNSIGGTYFSVFASGTNGVQYVMKYPNDTVVYNSYSTEQVVSGTEYNYFSVDFVGTSYYSGVVHYTGKNINGNFVQSTKSVSVDKPNLDIANHGIVESTPITVDDVPIVEVPPLFPSSVPEVGIEANPDVTGLPETVEIVIPDGAIADNDPIDTPWNEPLTEPAPEPDPIGEALDPDGDGRVPTEDGTPANPWKNLLPHVWLMALLDLLRAIIEYLVRMFDYVLSIPFVSAKPIDNSAFDWFKNVTILGINPFQVISSFAMVGLAFSVYRIIRKVLP